MVEAFDCWRLGKKRDDYSRVLSMSGTRRTSPPWSAATRNHPSVIQWSIGNEVRELFEADGWKTGAHLAAIVRGEDRTRPVVAGMHNIMAPYNGFQTVVDVIGYNYKPTEYAKVRATHPQLPPHGLGDGLDHQLPRRIFSSRVSEDKAQGRADFQMSSYDLYAPRWALPPDVEFKGLDESPYTMGEFVLDRLRLPRRAHRPTTPTPPTCSITPTRPTAKKAAQELAALGKIKVPSRSSYFGIIDLAGLSEGSLLSLPGSLAARPADGAPPAALELAGARRPGHAGARLFVW